jgi:hypothetical protein
MLSLNLLISVSKIEELCGLCQEEVGDCKRNWFDYGRYARLFVTVAQRFTVALCLSLVCSHSIDEWQGYILWSVNKSAVCKLLIFFYPAGTTEGANLEN